jgi:hypothetical protein
MQIAPLHCNVFSGQPLIVIVLAPRLSSRFADSVTDPFSEKLAVIGEWIQSHLRLDKPSRLSAIQILRRPNRFVSKAGAATPRQRAGAQILLLRLLGERVNAGWSKV